MKIVFYRKELVHNLVICIRCYYERFYQLAYLDQDFERSKNIRCFAMYLVFYSAMLHIINDDYKDFLLRFIDKTFIYRY